MTTETKVPSTTGGTFVSYRQDRTESGVHGQRSKTRKPAGGSAGFTLLELLVTVGVLAIIAGIAIPSFLSHRQNMFDNMAISDAQQLQMAMQARATRMDGRLTWQTGGMPSLVGNFSPTEGVEHRVFMNDMNQWCALSWHERGTLNSPDNPAWVASDSGGLRTGGPLNSEVCGELADFWDDITPPDPNNPSEPTDPSEVDTDGDGIPDDLELELGLDPEVDQRLVMEFETSGVVRLPGGEEIARSRTITLPAMSGATVWVDWGDGTPLHRLTGSPSATAPWTHTFDSDGTFTVTLHGTIPVLGTGTGVANSMSQEQLISLTRVPLWAETGTTSASGAFFHAAGLADVAPPPSTVTNMSAMFRGASNFDGSVEGWDTSNVTTMALMFMNATSFSGDGIGGWNTASLTDTFEMFREARAFNQNLNTAGNRWNVSGVTRMGHMFDNARSFNGTLTNWDTSSATSMVAMFRATPFNRALDHFDTSDVRNMANMFQWATEFNRSLDTWDTSSAVTMAHMFRDAESFNGNIASWDTSSVEDMDSMFRGAAAFNQDIGLWDSDDNMWDTSAVTNMSNMFNGASAFTHDLSCWNTQSMGTTVPSGFDTGTHAEFTTARRPGSNTWGVNPRCGEWHDLTPLNGWTVGQGNQDVFGHPRAIRLSRELVVVEGFVQRPSAPVNSALGDIAQLPAWMTPATQHVFASLANNSTIRMQVEGTGMINVRHNGALAMAWTTLTPVIFTPASAQVTPQALDAGWEPFSAENAQFGFVDDWQGRRFQQGLLRRNGANVANQTIATWGDASRPFIHMQVPQIGDGTASSVRAPFASGSSTQVVAQANNVGSWQSVALTNARPTGVNLLSRTTACTGVSEAEAFRHSDGFVFLARNFRGCPVGQGAGATIANLPAGSRPTGGRQIFPVANINGTRLAFGRVDVFPDGQVVLDRQTAASVPAAFDVWNIQFVAR